VLGQASCAPPQSHAEAAGHRERPHRHERLKHARLAARMPPRRPQAARRPKVSCWCVWDGLRPDSVSPERTPNLARLRDVEGVNFQDHHAAYPTFTID